MSQYRITKTSAKQIPLDWSSVTALDIRIFPWYESGEKQDTQVKIVANDKTLFIQVIAQDKYSFAKQTELNHMLVCADSCVEFFFSPSGVLGSSYVNLEVNCCGTLHLAYGAGRDNRQFISLETASLIARQTSLNAPVKIESEHDNEWRVEIALPFSAIEQLTGEKVNKDQWFANFYRCGGRTEPQYAVWNNIDVATPDYHRPEHFGELVFI
ncbi:carbohydrate-binding family 9-like protein [Colwellia piezophila]|uniref:carbohydrate-binding family 9-like protein n=1 Tax=Colwellia piezophila TaxID=211668 RepID=UPI000373543F|nr:carbohydrate-binding family 9-like protein [Colwellia piezophila]